MADQIFRAEWLAFEKELGFRPLLRGPTYEDLLEQNNQIKQGIFKVCKAPAVDDDVMISDDYASTGVRLRIYRPPQVKPNQPIVCYYHGGGFIFGSIQESDALVRRYTKDTGLIFVSVEYRLAPEDPYPAGCADCVEAAEWCIENAQRLGGRPQKVVLMGHSAGASFALASALNLITHRKTGYLQGLVVCSPSTIHPEAVPDDFKGRYSSYVEHDQHTINTKAAMKVFLDSHGAPRTDPYVFSALNRRLKDLPCVYLSACELDTLRDDARILRELLEKDNVLVKHDEYAGLPHSFFSYPSPHLDGLRNEYFAKTAEGIKFVVDSSEIALEAESKKS